MKLMLKGAVVCLRISRIMTRSCSAGVKPTPIAPTPSTTAHRKREVRCHAGEGQALAGKRVLAAKALGEPRDNVAHDAPPMM